MSTVRQTAIIVGVGPFISRSLGTWLVQQGYDIGLISRSQSGLDKCRGRCVFANALDTIKDKLHGKVDDLIYNAARVGPNDLLQLAPEVLEHDFRTSAIGMLIAGQWFSKNTKAENNPRLLVTGGTLDREPNADYASLSAVKASSQNISVMFSKILPEMHGILVGTLIVEPIIPAGDKGGYVTKSDPDVTVEKIFKPYFDLRGKIERSGWWNASGKCPPADHVDSAFAKTSAEASSKFNPQVFRFTALSSDKEAFGPEIFVHIDCDQSTTSEQRADVQLSQSYPRSLTLREISTSSIACVWSSPSTPFTATAICSSLAHSLLSWNSPFQMVRSEKPESRDTPDGDASVRNFIFVGSTIAGTESKDNIRSLVMREYYRRKKAAVPKCNRATLRVQPKASTRLAAEKVISASAKTSLHEQTDDSVGAVQGFKQGSKQLCASDSNSSVPPTNKGSDNGVALNPIRRDPSTCPPLEIFHDPVSQLTKHLDSQARDHLRRYFALPTLMLGLSSNTFTCIVYNFPLAVRFPVVVDSFVAFSSRQVDAHQSVLGTVSLRHHNRIIATVNEKITHPTRENYNTILLGIQGAIASSYASGDHHEFAMHVRGQAHFLRDYGPPSDPDVMLHLVANSLVYGRNVVDPLYELYPTQDGMRSFNQEAEIVDLRMAASQLAELSGKIHLQSLRFSSEHLLRQRSISQQKLFSPGSILYQVLREITGTESTSNQWHRQFEISHHPFLAIYLTLVQIDLENTPCDHQEDVYASITSTLKEARITRTAGSVTANWTLLCKFKYNTKRTWKASRLLRVLLRLSHDTLRKILRLLIWYLTLDTVPPVLDLADLTGLPKEVSPDFPVGFEELAAN